MRQFTVTVNKNSCTRATRCSPSVIRVGVVSVNIRIFETFERRAELGYVNVRIFETFERRAELGYI